ncbi:hypothetical protein FQZ97_673290 [compost metagenome]
MRLGKQVVSWGESTFIQNSINAINPVDAAAFRRPGAEIKEGLIPVNMFFVSQSLTENLSAEAFYQLEWDQTVIDNCGTFFAQADVAADGCTDNLRLLTNNLAVGNAVNTALAGSGLEIEQNSEGTLARRGPDRDARDDGQWGLALRYMFAPLDTEFGLFAMNYHSRTPNISVTSPAQSVYNAAAQAGAAAPLVVGGNSRYFLEYPEDIRLYGLSFATTLPTGTAWQGEVSYRPNAPVQMTTTDVLFAAVGPLADLSPAFAAFGNASVLDGAPDTDIHGYRRKEITQLQTTFTHFFDQVMGAGRVTLIGELGWTHVGGLESTREARYGRDPVFGPGPLPATGPANTCRALNQSTLAGAVGNGNFENLTKNCVDDGYVTTTSWGYRARVIWDYSDVFAGVNLKPSISWSHDVDGYGPNGLFNEGAKAVSLGLDAEYDSAYTASLSYTDFFGGDFNTSIDRDFVALSFGVNF